MFPYRVRFLYRVKQVKKKLQVFYQTGGEKKTDISFGGDEHMVFFLADLGDLYVFIYEKRMLNVVFFFFLVFVYMIDIFSYSSIIYLIHLDFRLDLEGNWKDFAKIRLFSLSITNDRNEGVWTTYMLGY